MLIFTGEQPKNPCEGCEYVEALCPVPKSVCQEYREYQGQLSILNQCVEVYALRENLQLIRSICLELFDIWQEAKRDYDDNWNDVVYDQLPDKHKWEYEKTARRIIDSFSQFLQEQIKKQESKNGKIS